MEGIICEEKNMLNNISDIIRLYDEYGSRDYIGEDVSITEHSIQAALLAKNEYPDDYESIAGALLHDIGHLLGMKYDLEEMVNLGCLHHEAVGAETLQKIGMCEKVCELVKNHVNAKRYLVGKHTEYYENLTEASKQTLNYQGGKMNEEEIKQFEIHPYFSLFIKLRTWDDKAKIKYLSTPNFVDFKECLEKCLRKK